MLISIGNGYLFCAEQSFVFELSVQYYVFILLFIGMDG
jgi:hypothetical protein